MRFASAGVAGLTVFLLVVAGLGSSSASAPTHPGGASPLVQPSVRPLSINSSYFDEGGSWNCGQGHETMAFFGDASGGTGPYTYSWNYGDGTPNATSANPVHTYEGLGPFVAHVTVLDSASATNESTLTVEWNVPLSCSNPSPINWAGVATYGLFLAGAVAFIGGVWRWRRRPPT